MILTRIVKYCTYRLHAFILFFYCFDHVGMDLDNKSKADFIGCFAPG
jgi:hypothetical protein